MGFARKFRNVTMCVALLFGGAAALAAPPEPLVVTRLADPDPNYVPSTSERASGKRLRHREARPIFDAAMQDFGRAIGQAAMLEQQAIEQRCRSGAPADASATDRFAWEASCRYTRR